MRAGYVSEKNGNIKGLYVESVTGKILSILDDILDYDVTDKKFLIVQENLRLFIASQYVEKEDRTNEHGR